MSPHHRRARILMRINWVAVATFVLFVGGAIVIALVSLQ